MNVVIQQTPEHRTFDGHTATYAVCRDLITAKRLAMFQVLHTADGQRYRTMNRTPMPEGFDLADAIRFAAAESTTVEDRTLQAA